MSGKHMRRSNWLSFLMIASSPVILAAQEPQGVPLAGWPYSTNMPLKQVGPGLFEIGKVRLDKDRKTISFPAVLNMNEALIEYLVVTSAGKVHESLLRTDTEPWHVHLAMLLLGAQGAGTNSFPEDHNRPLPGDKISIEVSWKARGKEKRHRAEELVYDRTKKSAMRKSQWIYTGSKVIDGTFIAQRDGSVISLIEDAEALVNNPLPGRDNDDNWQVNAVGFPPLESSVQVTIKLEAPKASRE
jgi:hypothetical protein